MHALFFSDPHSFSHTPSLCLLTFCPPSNHSLSGGELCKTFSPRLKPLCSPLFYNVFVLKLLTQTFSTSPQEANFADIFSPSTLASALTGHSPISSLSSPEQSKAYSEPARPPRNGWRTPPPVVVPSTEEPPSDGEGLNNFKSFVLIWTEPRLE